MNRSAMHVSALKSEVQVYTLLRQRVFDQHPGLDDETIRDTLEGITSLHELISELIRSALVDEALQAGLRTRLEEMRQRLARLEERGAKKRQLALDAMCEVGLKKLDSPILLPRRAPAQSPWSSSPTILSQSLIGFPNRLSSTAKPSLPL